MCMHVYFIEWFKRKEMSPVFKNNDELKWDPEQYRSLVILCTKVKNLVKIWNTLTYWSRRMHMYVRTGFFLKTFYERVEKNIFGAGFFRSTYNLNPNSLIDILWFLGKDSFPLWLLYMYICVPNLLWIIPIGE